MDTRNTTPLSRLRELTERLPLVLHPGTESELLDLLPVGIWQSDGSGNVTYANRLMCDMLGRTPEQMIGLGGAEGIHPHDRDWALGLWEFANRTRHRFSAILRYLSKDDVTTTVFVVANTDQPEGVSGSIGVAVPIFEERAKDDQQVPR